MRHWLVVDGTRVTEVLNFEIEEGRTKTERLQTLDGVHEVEVGRDPDRFTCELVDDPGMVHGRSLELADDTGAVVYALRPEGVSRRGSRIRMRGLLLRRR